MKQLTIEGLRALADAGAVSHVKIIATEEGLYVEINGVFTVTNRAKRPRYFKKADTCFSWLRGMGIVTINETDLSRWEVWIQPILAGSSGELPIVENVYIGRILFISAYRKTLSPYLYGG